MKPPIRFSFWIPVPSMPWFTDDEQQKSEFRFYRTDSYYPYYIYKKFLD